MATVAEMTPPVAENPAGQVTLLAPIPRDLEGRQRIGPDDHGRRMSLEDFIASEFEEGWIYELGRGVIVVTQVPGIHDGRIVGRTSDLFTFYDRDHPDVTNYRAGGMECRLRLPGMRSDRHPDQAVYLLPPPVDDDQPWMRWIPEIVVEVVSEGGQERDYVEKREDYLRAGVREYWILNPNTRVLHALRRAGDVWDEATITADGVYRTGLLPGLEVRPAELFGPAEAE